MPKTIATLETYDRHKATSTGWDVAIRDNETIRLVSHSRWQGSRDGETFLAPATPEIMTAARGDAGADDPDLEAAVRNWLDTPAGAPEAWRRIRCGHVIR